MVPTQAVETAPVESAMDLALSVSEVSKQFPGVRALSGVSLEVRRGEVHGVLGENGAGKSTLMAIISGVLEADEGSVSIGGKLLDHANPELARELGVAIVRQEPALLPDLSVAENLYLAMKPAQRPRVDRITAWAKEQLAMWSDDVPVDVNDRVESLRPQQRFIVEICRALSQDPDVLILDEPTEHLVREEAEILFGHIRDYAARGKAVVYISHRIPDVCAISHRISILRNGRPAGSFNTNELTEDEIVSLIIGRDLEAYFPSKEVAPQSSQGALELHGFQTNGVEPVSTVFEPGTIVGLAGMDGNGQRQFLRALAGLEKSSGSLSVGARTIPNHSMHTAAKARFAYLAGDRAREGILPTLSVRENIVFRNLRRVSTLGWVKRRGERAFSDGVIGDFNVKTPSGEAPIEALSGGNQQKTLIGGALASEPAVFLVDEPTQGVDIGARSEIYRLLREAANAGAVVIVLSSDAAELAGIANRVLVFARGRIVEELVGDDITEHGITASALNAASSPEHVRAAVEQEARKRSFLAGDGAPPIVGAALLIIVAVIGTMANSQFIGPYNLSGVLTLAAVLGFVACGQLLVLLTGGIDLSVGPVSGLVVVISSFYLVDGATGGQQATGWILMFGAALFAGVCNWLIIDFAKINPIIATLITYMGIQGISSALRPTPGGAVSPTIMDSVAVALGPIPVVFIIACVIAVVADVLLRRSRPGVALRAVGSDERTARMNGLSPRFVRFCAYVGSSGFAALAGVVLMSQTGTGDSTLGVSLTLVSITAAVIGGASVFGARGSFIGAIVGAVLVQAVNALTVFLGLSPDYQYYLTGVLTLGAVTLFSLARQRAKASS